MSQISLIMSHRFLLLVFLIFSSLSFLRAKEDRTTCSLTGEEADPSLQEMTFDVGDGSKTFLAYVEPDIASFYQGNPPASTAVVPQFDGFAAKFINMSNRRLTLYWESSKGGPVSPMRKYVPFSSAGTATFPNHRFFFSPEGADPKNERTKEFVMGVYPQNLYVYDPYLVEGDEEATEKNLELLDVEERKLYDLWKKALMFNEQYFNFTNERTNGRGRTWLPSLRDRPIHFMWPADYFGQEHWVTTRETHFIKELPPLDEIEPITVIGEQRVLKEDEPRHMQEYRVLESQMNMTLRVLSCAPRVLEIENFLSGVEIDHILQIASAAELKRSQTGFGGGDDLDGDDETKRSKTRTSTNDWIPRERTPVVDAIYRRAADLTRIPEALLRARGKTEHPDMPDRKTVSESLQLVHYDVGQEYTAHSDFGYTAIDSKHHGTRYLTLLLYLNDVEAGGGTSFPRWVNAETFRRLTIQPKAGKAVLF